MRARFRSLHLRLPGSWLECRTRVGGSIPLVRPRKELLQIRRPQCCRKRTATRSTWPAASGPNWTLAVQHYLAKELVRQSVLGIRSIEKWASRFQEAGSQISCDTPGRRGCCRYSLAIGFDEVRNVAVVYGGAHMRAVIAELTRRRDYIAGDTQWLTVFWRGGAPASLLPLPRLGIG